MTILEVAIDRQLALVSEHNQIVQCQQRSIVSRFFHVEDHLVLEQNLFVEFVDSPRVFRAKTFTIKTIKC